MFQSLISMHIFFISYEDSNDILGDVDCQKRAICEIYRNSAELGEISTRAQHSLNFLESFSLMSLPDEFMNIVDEFMVIFLNNRCENLIRSLLFLSQDAQTSGKSPETIQCQDLYYCPKSILELRRMYNQI